MPAANPTLLQSSWLWPRVLVGRTAFERKDPHVVGFPSCPFFLFPSFHFLALQVKGNGLEFWHDLLFRVPFPTRSKPALALKDQWVAKQSAQQARRYAWQDREANGKDVSHSLRLTRPTSWGIDHVMYIHVLCSWKVPLGILRIFMLSFCLQASFAAASKLRLHITSDFKLLGKMHRVVLDWQPQTCRMSEAFVNVPNGCLFASHSHWMISWQVYLWLKHSRFIVFWNLQNYIHAMFQEFRFFRKEFTCGVSA